MNIPVCLFVITLEYSSSVTSLVHSSYLFLSSDSAVYLISVYLYVTTIDKILGHVYFIGLSISSFRYPIVISSSAHLYVSLILTLSSRSPVCRGSWETYIVGCNDCRPWEVIRRETFTWRTGAGQLLLQCWPATQSTCRRQDLTACWNNHHHRSPYVVIW